MLICVQKVLVRIENYELTAKRMLCLCQTQRGISKHGTGVAVISVPNEYVLLDRRS